MIRDFIELSDLSDNIILTTAKDRSRMQSEKLENIVSLLPIFVIDIDIEFVSKDQQKIFNQIIIDYVRRKES